MGIALGERGHLPGELGLHDGVGHRDHDGARPRVEALALRVGLVRLDVMLVDTVRFRPLRVVVGELLRGEGAPRAHEVQQPLVRRGLDRGRDFAFRTQSGLIGTLAKCVDPSARSPLVGVNPGSSLARTVRRSSRPTLGSLRT